MKNRALVVAHDESLGIGKDNQLPWHIKADLKHFRDLTINKDVESENSIENVVLMGRKTWESLPDPYRPLPKRCNVVISRNPNYQLPENVLLSGSVEEGLTAFKTRAETNIFVIGGSAIYQSALKLNVFNSIYVTEIEGKFGCDVFFSRIQK